MLIKNINIKNFGKLSDVNISPDAGLNVVFMPNEGGKTTLLSFLKYIFYGVKQKKSYKDLTFKERYMPWNSLPMSGSCEFSTDSGEYIVQRNDSDTTAKLNVINLKTGTEEKKITNPGAEFFGVGEIAFSDSFLIGDLNGLNDFSKSGEILSLLSDSCSDQNTYHKVRAELLERLAQLNSTKRKSSKTEIINAKISDCEIQLFQCQSKLKDLTEKISEVSKLEEKANIEKSEIDKLYIQKNEDIINTVKSEMEILFKEKEHLEKEQNKPNHNRVLNAEEKELLISDFSEYTENISRKRYSKLINYFLGSLFLVISALCVYPSVNYSNLFYIPCILSFLVMLLFYFKGIKLGSVINEMHNNFDLIKENQASLMNELNLTNRSECILYISAQNSNVNTYDSKYVTDRLNQINNKLEKYWNIINNFNSSNDLESCDTIFFTNHKLDDIIKKREQSLTELYERINRLSHYKTEINSVNGEITDIKNEIKRLEAEKQLIANDAEVIECSLMILDKAFSDTKETFVPSLTGKTKEIYEYIVNENYKSVNLDEEFNLFFNKDGFLRSSKYLSSGACDALYFSMKVAVLKTISRDKLVMPLFIDDIFANCDDERAKRMVDVIYRLSEKFQIFMCTCRKREIEFLKDKKDVNIISI